MAYLDETGLEHLWGILKGTFIQSVNGIKADASGNITIAFGDEGGGSSIGGMGGGILPLVVVDQPLSTLYEPETIYILPEKAGNLTDPYYWIQLHDVDDGYFHTYTLIMEIGDQKPTMLWPESLRFTNEFNISPNSVVIVRIINNVMLWDYLWQESPELVLFDKDATDPYCSNVSGGWSHSYYSDTNANQDPTMLTDKTIEIHTVGTSNRYWATAVNNTPLNIQSLYDAGYRYINVTGYAPNQTSVNNHVDIALTTAKVISNNKGIALGAYYQTSRANSGIASPMNPYSRTLDIAGALAAGVGSAGYVTVLGYGLNVSGMGGRGITISKVWFSKEVGETS